MAAKDVIFGGAVRNDDAGSGLGFVFDALDDHAIVQRAKLHWISELEVFVEHQRRTGI